MWFLSNMTLLTFLLLKLLRYLGNTLLPTENILSIPLVLIFEYSNANASLNEFGYAKW